MGQAKGKGKNSRIPWEHGRQPRSPGECKRLLNSDINTKQNTPPPKYMYTCGMCMYKTENKWLYNFPSKTNFNDNFN